MQAAAAFLIKFVHFFDTDRTSLIDVYAQHSVFSMSINPVIPAGIATGRREDSDGFYCRDVDFSLTKSSGRSRQNTCKY
jgi:hypothetical protein